MRLKIACVIAALLASSATPALAAKRIKGSERSERTVVTTPITTPSFTPTASGPTSVSPPSVSGGGTSSGAPDCSTVSFNVGTVSCSGFYSGNLITEGGPKLTESLNITGGLDPSASSLIEKIEWSKGMNDSIIDFDGTFSGQVLIGIHFGGGKRGYNGTGFWLLDVPEELDSIRWTSRVQGGISNAGLYLIGNVIEIPPEVPNPQATPVPEPTTWAMMLFGFGAIGYGLRRRKKPLAGLATA